MAEDAANTAAARGELEPLGAARLRAAGNKRPAHAHAAAWAPRLDLLALGVTTVPPGGKGLAAEARPTLAVLRLKEAQEVWAEVSANRPTDPTARSRPTHPAAADDEKTPLRSRACRRRRRRCSGGRTARRCWWGPPTASCWRWTRGRASR